MPEYRFLSLFFLLCSRFLFAQEEFTEIDRFALSYEPDVFKTSLAQTARGLCGGIAGEERRARAIYVWITSHIHYVDSTDGKEIWATPEDLRRQRAEQVLRNRTAVCLGYANLFCALGRYVGLKCEVVTGIVKDPDGSIASVGHAWVAARIDKKWRLFDPTWGAPERGGRFQKIREEYFMTPPEEFVLEHLPDDPMWQLLENPVSEKIFRDFTAAEMRGRLSNTPALIFNFKDTLAVWLKLDSVERFEHAASRIKRLNAGNERAVFQLGRNYYGKFFDLYFQLDSIVDASILNGKIRLDTLKFTAQLDRMRYYYDQAQNLFGTIKSRERKDRIGKYFTEKDLEGLYRYLHGCMWVAVVQNRLEFLDGINSAAQLEKIRYPISKADRLFKEANPYLDCAKLQNTCNEIPNNLSLVYLQLGNRHVKLLQNLLKSPASAKNKLSAELVEEIISDGDYYYGRAEEEAKVLTQKPPVFEFIVNRIRSTRQGRLNLQMLNIQYRTFEITDQLDEFAGGQEDLSRPATIDKTRKMRVLVDDIADLSQKIENADVETEFRETAGYNLQLQGYTLSYNLGSLYYRLAIEGYNRNLREKSMAAAEKKTIRQDADDSLTLLKNAERLLDPMKQKGIIPASEIARRKSSLQKLQKGTEEVLEALKRY